MNLRILLLFIVVTLYSFPIFAQDNNYQNTSYADKDRGWVPVNSFNRSIFTNADSALRVYKDLVEKKNVLDKKAKTAYEQFSSTIQKTAFETSADFEIRKQNAINTKKLEMENLLAPYNDVLYEFQDGFVEIVDDRYGIILSDKEYNADLQLWEFKIKDQIDNNIYNAFIKITPYAAEKLWINKNELKPRHLKDINNASSSFVWLDFPEFNYESQLPIVLKPDYGYRDLILNKNNSINFKNLPVINDIYLKIHETYVNQNDQPLLVQSNTNTSVPEEETNKIFTSVQIQSTFPGGAYEWTKFLTRNLNRDLPIENGAPAGIYKVIVSFIVDRDGSIADVRAENNPGYGTAEEAVRVIKKGPKWTPAEQNGRKVIYRHRQVIGFQVSDDGDGPTIKMKKRQVY
jgi:hypothetical protein